MTSAASRADPQEMAAAAPAAAAPRKRRGPEQRSPEVGEALRAIYRSAVAEQVPDELLDLLNKLG